MWSSRRASRWLRATLALVGVAAIAIGVVAVFFSNKGAASLLLLTSGVVLVLIGWLGPRVELESFELLGAKLRVREVVAQRIRLSQTGVPAEEEADRLRRQALTLQSLDRLHRLYAYVRATQPAGGSRTRALDEIALRMQSEATKTEFDPAEVATWFQEGNDGLRIVALNVMIARPDGADVLAALTAIDEPRSPFEQYYGLRLAAAMIPRLDSLDRDLLAAAVSRASKRRRVRRDAPLAAQANSIMESLKPQAR